MARWQPALVGFLLLAAAAVAVARADGFYVQSVAIAESPTIPAQKALIAWRDGVERLVVESTVQGQGESFAWLVPVPAAPTAIEEAPPFLLRSLSLQAGPLLVDEVPGWMVPVALAGLVGVVLLGRPNAVRILVYLGLALFFGALFIPNFVRARGGVDTVDVAGVQVLQDSRVGSYDVSVLEVRDAGAVQEWLDGNGYGRLPETAGPVVEEYVRQGWRFLASRLRRQGQGAATPHPLAVTFPARQPVYPMRLTALAEAPTRLDLFVVAPGRARAPHLEVVLCDLLDPLSAGSWKGRDTGLEIAYLDLGAWPGCTLTRLGGTLAPADMLQDLTVELEQPARTTRPLVYSREGAVRTAVKWSLWLWLAGLAATALLEPLRRRGSGAAEPRSTAGPWALAALVAFLALYALLPKVDVVRGKAGPSACKSNLKNLGVGLEMYSTDFDGHYPLALTDLTPDYFKTLPTCGGLDTYSGGYTRAENPDAYTVQCASANHVAQDVPPGYPLYNSFTGLVEK